MSSILDAKLLGGNMQAFHNDIEIKNKYLNRVMAHFDADELIKGKYWQNGKGCAVGCTIHSSEHKQFEVELGIPEWLARVEDRIFEGLPNGKAKEWPVKFLAAIHVGADLQKVKAPFLIFVLESALTTFDHKKSPKVKDAIDGVIALYKRGDATPAEFRAAAADAYAADADAAAAAYAAYADYAAAAAAAYAAYAAYAAAAAAAYADAAAAAADAADDAADAADAADADADAARKNTYEKFADKLLELLGNCK